MPFLPSPRASVTFDDAAQLDPPDVVLAADDKLTAHGYLDGDRVARFKLLTPLRFQDKSGAVTDVPASGPASTTDLASVPPVMWGILAPYGRQLRPALLHDHLCRQAKRRPDDQKFAARREADDLFREALRSTGVAVVRRNLFWAGVSFNRYLTFRRAVGVVIIVLAVLSTVALWTALVALVTGHTGLGAVLLAGWAVALLAVSGLFRSDFRAVATMLAAAPVVAPAALVTLVTDVLLFVLDWVLTLALRLAGVETGSPDVGPTLDWDVGRS